MGHASPCQIYIPKSTYLPTMESVEKISTTTIGPVRERDVEEEEETEEEILDRRPGRLCVCCSFIRK